MEIKSTCFKKSLLNVLYIQKKKSVKGRMHSTHNKVYRAESANFSLINLSLFLFKDLLTPQNYLHCSKMSKTIQTFLKCPNMCYLVLWPCFNIPKTNLTLTHLDIFFPNGQKPLLLPPICLDLSSVGILSQWER